MKGAEGFVRFLCLAPLLALALALPGATWGPVGPGLAFALLAAYARLASLASSASGIEVLLLLAETLPFFAYCEALAGGRGLGSALLATVEAACAGSALLMLESLVDGERRKVAASLAFIAAAAATGLAIERLNPATVLGGCAIVIALCAFARRRGV